MSPFSLLNFWDRRVPGRYMVGRPTVPEGFKEVQQQVHHGEKYSKTMSRRSCWTRTRKNPGSDPVGERRCRSSPPSQSRLKWISSTSCSTRRGQSGCLEGEAGTAGAISPFFTTGSKFQARDFFCKPSRAVFKLERPSRAGFKMEIG